MLHLTNFKELKLSNHLWDIDEETDCELCIEYGCVCENHSDIEWDIVREDIREIARELTERGWEYFSAGGYMGWNKSASNTGIYELNGETLRSVLFCYNTEMDITIDFTNIHNDIFEVKMYHHDSPSGETVYFVKEKNINEDEWDNPREHCIEVARKKGLR